MNTRILVTVSYISNTIVNLVRTDGTVFQTVKVGEPFRVGNQMRDYVPQFCHKDNKVHCRKFDNAGHVMEDIYLPRSRKVLWALTSGAARRGLFHIYREPVDSLDAALQHLGFGKGVITVVDEVKDVAVNDRGPDCGHQLRPFGYVFSTDGEAVIKYRGECEGSDHPNGFHRGCKIEPDLYLVNGGSYVIEWIYYGCLSGNRGDRIQKIIMTKDCDRDAVYRAIYDHYREGQNPLDK